MPLLSICIPTYNRPDCLREAIQSVLDSSLLCRNEIEILVADDGTAPETLQVLEEFKEEFKNGSYPELRFYRNPVNLGIDDNFFAVTQQAAGTFVLLLGDDDRLAQNAIPEILARIKAGSDLVISNFSIWSKDFSEKRQDWSFPFREDRVFTDPNEVLETFGLCLGYISIVTMKKSKVLSISRAQCEAYRGCGFPLLYSIYASLLPSCRVSYVGGSLIYNRSDNSGQYDWHHYFITGSSTIFEGLRKAGFSRQAVHQANRLVLLDFIIYNLIGLRFSNTPKAGLLGLLFKAYKFQTLFWWLILPIQWAPFKWLLSLKESLLQLPKNLKFKMLH